MNGSDTGSRIRAEPQPKGPSARRGGSSVTTVLDSATRGLVRVALGLVGASEAQLGEWMAEARQAGTPDLWLEELLISGVVFVGFPRALVAMAEYRRLVPEPAAGAEVTDYAQWPEWRARGEAACRAVYGKHYAFLRRNVRGLHPALEEWMIVDGYGKTLGRPGLDLMRRELCSVGLLVPQQAPRQLLAHLRGALNTGATAPQIDELFELAGGVAVPPERVAVALDLWRELRDTLLHD
jgi:4-carboxymuconolactone decarboxylase